MRRTTMIGLAAVAALLGGALAATPAAAAPVRARHFASCAQLHRVYHHGVGMPGAVDRVRGHARPVTTFVRSAALFDANRHLDGDRDRIACEQR